MVNRVLVVDEDLDLCELLDRYLRREGFEFETANDGERGVRRALSSEHALVVLDILLPGINGFEALGYIRSESQIPIKLQDSAHERRRVTPTEVSGRVPKFVGNRLAQAFPICAPGLKSPHQRSRLRRVVGFGQVLPSET